MRIAPSSIDHCEKKVGVFRQFHRQTAKSTANWRWTWRSANHVGRDTWGKNGTATAKLAEGPGEAIFS